MLVILSSRLAMSIKNPQSVSHFIKFTFLPGVIQNAWKLTYRQHFVFQRTLFYFYLMPDFRFIKASSCFLGDESSAIFRSFLSVKYRCSDWDIFKISSSILDSRLRRFMICVTRARLMPCLRASSALLTDPVSNCCWNYFAIWRGWGAGGLFFLAFE